ncbi:class II fructose-bisphosphate aldolase [Streptomyces lichenis]|uniref:Class II fructose-bisphosphate aldolase family protein n=1 Tax=Streptomyces lichenis TaxID=2306967 RepID=A0ABT0I909_9ACTN|nr:class II fructose-bisphosphate aldolase [Streptomyces lichenis]MCK8677793.1 class II fructose-bisphosphate aldolase family protein [Streptomyces lichenis]
MPLTTTRALVDRAAARGEAVVAFNVITLEHVEAVLDGVRGTGRPVILQISENAVAYHGGRPEPLAAAAARCAEQSEVEAALHLDHVTDEGLLHRAADAGFSSAMFDAARLPYAANVQATRRAADWAHRNGLWLEAELGEVGGKDGRPPLDAHAPGARTDPAEAVRYVAETGVDALAVAVGSSHAMTSRDAVLDHGLLAGLRAALEVPLVLHGSSGVPDGELGRAIRAGIAKVNIGTALNVALTAAVREHLDRHPDGVDPRRYLDAGRTAMAAAAARLAQAVAQATQVPPAPAATA